MQSHNMDGIIEKEWSLFLFSTFGNYVLYMNHMYVQNCTEPSSSSREFIFLCLVVSLQESPGEVIDYPMFISIGDWLDTIKMSQYKSNFVAAGFNTLDSVARMSIE